MARRLCSPDRPVGQGHRGLPPYRIPKWLGSHTNPEKDAFDGTSKNCRACPIPGTLRFKSKEDVGKDLQMGVGREAGETFLRNAVPPGFPFPAKNPIADASSYRYFGRVRHTHALPLPHEYVCCGLFLIKRLNVF